MEKVFFLVGLLSICAIAVNAAPTTTVSTYKGTRAGDKDHPCKGRTIRNCAVVTVTTDKLSAGMVAVTESVTYAEGDNVTSVTLVKNKTVEVVTQEVISKHLQNGGYVESSN